MLTFTIIILNAVIYTIEFHYIRPAVQRLSLYLPNQQSVIYNALPSLDSVISQAGIERTMFT